jgi:HTH-type transcriptional regulator/antitoxin HigA
MDGELAGTGLDINEEERIANIAAQEFCVPTDLLDKFIARKAPFFYEQDVIAFARMLKVHPGIVVGRLHRSTGRYDRLARPS